MNDQKPQLFDSKTLIALVLTGLVFFVWQTHMSKKYPPQISSAPKAPAETNSGENPAQSPPVTADGSATTTTTATLQSGLESKSIPENFISFDTDLVSFQVSNYGFGIRNYKIKSYVDDAKNPITLGEEGVGDLFVLTHGDQPIVFDIKEISFGHFEGTGRVENTLVKRTMIYDPLKYAFQSSIQIENGSSEFFKTPLKINLPDRIHIVKSTSFLFPSFNHQDFVSTSFDENEHTNIDRTDENIVKEIKVAQLVGIGTQYFAIGAIDQSSIAPSVRMVSDRSKDRALAQMIYSEVRAAPLVNLEQLFYAGPKSYDILKSVNENFTQLIDYGMFGFIAKPMLFAMKWFYGLSGNWGVALILLTLVVRFLVLPLYLMSVRSMKGMQKIQPRMKELQERYKGDPMTMNKEVWALMKQEKASPFGGCLPMLLQIPIFFALYRMISTSIELHQSPFMLWITDLSAYDHFFVLPILMGITMYFQQKITPTTMDPAQARILAFMPLIFTVFMISLPSGLTLYMFISSLFGIVQQLILVPQPAKAQKI